MEKEVDKKELKIALIKAGINMTQLADLLGLSRAGFYRKLNGKNHFTTKEIRNTSKILSLTTESREKIFLLDM